MEKQSFASSSRLSLKFFIFISLLGVSIVTFLLIFFITANTFQNAYITKSGDFSRGITAQITSSLLKLMEKGWTRSDLKDFVQPFKESNPDVPLQVNMFRSEKLQELFGTVDTENLNGIAAKVMRSGKSVFMEESQNIRHVVAVKAEKACLRCHTNQVAGEVMGVLDIQQDLSGVIRAIYLKIVVLFLLLSPLPFVIAALISRYSGRKIERSINLLHDTVKGVGSIKDLTTVELGSDRTEFAELDRILSEFNLFAEKIREIAIDKELLEFEVSLLEKFIITSEVVQDWKEHVGNLLVQVNKIMEAYALFSIFKVGEETYDLEIFWSGRPTQQTRKRFDGIIKKRIAEDPRLRFFSSITVNHNVADTNAPKVELEEKDIELQIKSIILESPQIGGVVGIGLQSVESRDEGRALVIEGILTTLVNVVGSVKAIDKYTKDVEFYVTRDPLTNLYNQRVFWELANNELARSRSRNQKFAIMVIDFDNFKMINDRYGHVFGDTYLQLFANKFSRTLREEDFLARYGGDKFTVIMPETGLEDARAEASRLMAVLDTMSINAPDGTKVKATVSIGLAIYPVHSKDANTLYMIAANQVFKAKKEGKNRIGIPTEADIREALRAMEEKSLFLLNLLEEKDKIIPLYQPIMKIPEGSTDIYELLMGIRHGGEIVPASSFIATAEKMGIVNQLDCINLEKAFQEIRDKQYQGKLFVNLSPSSLMQEGFIDTIKKMAEEKDILPANIVFEITEREAVSNRVMLDAFARELREEGFKFAIDDFGSGFSTFQYLKLFPVDYIKIEGEFIVNAPKDKKDRIFVKNIISLAKDLDILTIAEHVENEVTLQMMQELGADYAQGYHIKEPSMEIVCT